MAVKKRTKLEPGICRTPPSNEFPRGGYQGRVTFARRKYERTFDRLADARRWRNDTITDLRRGVFKDERIGNVPFKEVAEQWMATHAHLKANTRSGYEYIVNRYLLPAFGRKRIGSIKRGDVQKFVNAIQAQPRTARNVFRVLSPIMKYAVETDLVLANPCEGVKPPRLNHEDEQDMLILTPAQIDQLAQEIGKSYSLMIKFAGYTGLRSGEIAALRVKNVDLLHGEVRVRESVSDVSGSLHYDAPKTKFSRRTVPLPEFVVQELEAHLSGDPDSFVFASPQGRPLRHRNFYRRQFRPAVERLVKRGDWPKELLGLTFHQLRHTYASLLIKTGAHPRMVMGLMGHSSIAITMNLYGHLFPDDKAATVAKLHDLWAIEPNTNVTGAALEGR